MPFTRQLLVRICAFSLTLALFSVSYLYFGDQSKTNPYHALLANCEVIVANYNRKPSVRRIRRNRWAQESSIE